VVDGVPREHGGSVNAWPQIERCRRHQLNSDQAPHDIVCTSVLAGFVDIEYGSADGQRNPGSPYFLKLMLEGAEPFTELPYWDWEGAD
jgi:hypothetical protein